MSDENQKLASVLLGKKKMSPHLSQIPKVDFNGQIIF